VAATTSRLLDALVAAAPPKDRAEEARKGRERWRQRQERMAAGG
jgi:hypothetical protein